MPNLAAVLKDEIRCLAKREAKAQLGSLKTASTQYRRDIAALKRTNKELTRKVAHLEGALRKSPGAAPEIEDGREVRFAPEWVVNHRQKVGLSQADYGQLVGVSAVTIYHWEAGNSRPKPSLLAKWGAVKKLGKREAVQRLEALKGRGKGRKAPAKKRKKRRA